MRLEIKLLIAAIISALIIGVMLWAINQTGAQPAEEQPTEYDGKMIDLERDAIDKAFHGQVLRLFETWMKDETGQPKRALAGMRQARSAYIRSMRAIDERAKKVQQKGD